MKIERLGDDLVLRIPPEMAEALRLHEGDDLRIEPMASGLLLVTAPDPARQEALAALRRLAVAAPSGFRLSREDANERG